MQSRMVSNGEDREKAAAALTVLRLAPMSGRFVAPEGLHSPPFALAE